MDDDEEDVKDEKVRRRVPKGLETRATFSRRERERESVSNCNLKSVSRFIRILIIIYYKSFCYVRAVQS